MKTMGVTLVQAADSKPLSAGRAAWRYLVASLLLWGLLGAVWKASIWWLLVWPLPFAWSLFNRRHQTLYDVLVGTILISSPAAARKAAPELRSSSDPTAR